ncbi:14727_t:CDS:1 [Acaulospora colombiana]|uniref:14727_t:CDS:1 n=1 Tax=Acaulospora colombiana TaxID=27376 RepID=A0ACA9KQN3_9GLOM|nr:14727_t:CDS:1 [Acaulospora colombiana]
MPRASEINVEYFFTDPREKIGKKPLNSFILYRVVFTRELSRLNHKLNMENASKMAAIQWRNENAEVREEYERVAEMIEKRLKELQNELPKDFRGEFIYYSPSDLAYYHKETHQDVMDEELLGMLHLYYSKTPLEEYFENHQ